MNPDPLLKKLFAAGRRETPAPEVPVGFAHRVLHEIRRRPASDPLSAWASGLWRAALASGMVAMIALTLRLAQTTGAEAPGAGAQFNESDTFGDELELSVQDPLDASEPGTAVPQ